MGPCNAFYSFPLKCAGLEVSSLGIGAWSWGDRTGYWVGPSRPSPLPLGSPTLLQFPQSLYVEGGHMRQGLHRVRSIYHTVWLT